MDGDTRRARPVGGRAGRPDLLKPSSTESDARAGAVSRSPALAFVGLAFALSWLAGPALLVVGQRVLPVTMLPLADAGIKFGPSAAAVVVVTWLGSGSERRRFARAVTRLGISPAWYAGAVGLPIAVTLIVARVHGIDASGASAASTFGRAFATALFLGGGLGEEPGWRGYLYPRLRARLGTRPAMLGTGVVWGSWHLPMFVLGEDPAIGAGPVLLVSLAGAVVLGWLYDRTGGSVPVCACLHAAINAGMAVLVAGPLETPSALPWTYALGYAGVAAAGLAVAGGGRSRSVRPRS